jgi:hypothetical protein
VTRKRTSRMEEAQVQPGPDPRDAELEQLRARVAELEARPQTTTEVAALVEAACGERDRTRLQLERALAVIAKMPGAAEAYAEAVRGLQ